MTQKLPSDVATSAERLSSAAGDTPYHKGQIAERLLVETRRILETELVENISARRLCRAVGVTSANFYNHYPDLEYLLLEIAAQEFEKRARKYRTILRRKLGRDQSLIVLTQELVEFSVGHQQLFRIMFGYVADSSVNPNYASTSDEVMRVLVQIVYGEDRYVPEDLTLSHRTCAKAYAFLAFSSGLARAVSQGVFANPDGTAASRKRFVEDLTRIFISGLGRAPRATEG